MANGYISRNAVKRAALIWGSDKDAQVDRIIEAVSRDIDNATHRIFIPKTQTRLYRWPLRNNPANVLWLDFDLISVTALKSQAQNSSPTTIAAADYFLEPANFGPPYAKIEIDLSSSAAFSAGDTPQRSISVEGSWGFTNATVTAGTVSSGLATDAAATSLVGSNGSLVDVGDTLLIETEQVFVSGRDFATLSTILVNDAGITASVADNTITVDGSHGIVAGETIRLDSEEMYVTGVSTNVLSVIRAYNGTILATHADDTAVYINRTYTIVRAANGTTAAVHANSTAISKYDPPALIKELCLAEAIAAYQQETGAWGRTVGTGEGEKEFSGRDLARLRRDVRTEYFRGRMAAV